MSDPDKLRQAMDVIAKARKTPEEMIEERLQQLKNLDIMAELNKLDHFDEITKQLSEPERQEFDVRVDDIVDGYSSILDSVADLLKDPETRLGIIEELKRRAG